MTTAEELREWAMRDGMCNVNDMSYSAWEQFCLWRGQSDMLRPHGPSDYRTFALLVACALEDEHADQA